MPSFVIRVPVFVILPQDKPASSCATTLVKSPDSLMAPEKSWFLMTEHHLGRQSVPKSMRGTYHECCHTDENDPNMVISPYQRRASKVHKSICHVTLWNVYTYVLLSCRFMTLSWLNMNIHWVENKHVLQCFKNIACRNPQRPPSI